MQTHAMGRLYAQILKVEKAPLLHRAMTHQIEDPYYWGNSLVLRLPFGRAIALGWWRNPDPKADEMDLLLAALQITSKPGGWNISRATEGTRAPAEDHWQQEIQLDVEA